MQNNSRNIIKRPIITEKSMQDAQNKKYTFEVEKTANKTAVKLAAEEIFGVEVEKVYISNAKPRPRRVGRHAGYKRGFKKATIALTPESASIELFNA